MFRTLTQLYFENFNMVNYNMSTFLNYIFNFKKYLKTKDQMASLAHSTKHIKNN